jgi:hypothetical protein
MAEKRGQFFLGKHILLPSMLSPGNGYGGGSFPGSAGSGGC